MLSALLRLNAKRPHGSNGRILEHRNERYDLTKPLQPHDRIDDDLARSVVGHVAAALDLHDIDPTSSQRLLGNEQIRALSIAAERNNGFVLDNDPSVGIFAARNSCVKFALKCQHFAIWPPTEVEHANALHKADYRLSDERSRGTNTCGHAPAATGAFGFGLMI